MVGKQFQLVDTLTFTFSYLGTAEESLELKHVCWQWKILISQESDQFTRFAQRHTLLVRGGPKILPASGLEDSLLTRREGNQ